MRASRVWACTRAAAVRLLRQLLFGVALHDPIAFAGTVLLLTATAFAACLLPARRATRIAPIMALREE